jgi:hypothetical protein
MTGARRDQRRGRAPDPTAFVSDCGGKVARRIASVMGISIAPDTPWITRKTTSIPIDVESAPQAGSLDSSVLAARGLMIGLKQNSASASSRLPRC